MSNKNKNREVKQYLIVRSDLGASCGKMIAQAAHATMKVFFDKMNFREKLGASPPGSDEENKNAGTMSFDVTYEELQWIKGNFTKITKKVKNETQLLKVYNQAKEIGLNVSLIKDAGLFGLEGENYTVVAVGPNYEDKCDPVVRKLRLLTDLKSNK